MKKEVTAEDAKEWAAKGEKVVLVRLETSPEDIEGMKASRYVCGDFRFGTEEPLRYGYCITRVPEA